MNRIYCYVGLLIIVISAGCNYDIVTSKRLKELDYRCIYVAPIDSEEPQIGQVIKDVIEKEFMRKKVKLCDPNNATIFMTGSTFLTAKAVSSGTIIMSSSYSSQSIESVTLVAKDSNGEMLLSASYDNKDRLGASKLAQELGSAIADKLR